MPQSVLEACTKSGIKAIPTGIKHGTITAVLSGNAYEITTLRRDAKCDGRYASVVFTDDWVEDASRRDFTFNALYCDKHGTLYDYFSGVHDLQNRKVAFIGDAATRINEDFLRILRVFRFHATICSTNVLDSDIIGVCGKYADRLSLLSKERIRSEFFKLLDCSTCANTLQTMQQCGVLAQIIPPKYCIDISPLHSIHLSTRPPITKLAAMLQKAQQDHSVDAIVQDLTTLLRLSRKERKALEILLSEAPKLPLVHAQQIRYMNTFGIGMYKDLLVIGFLKDASIPEDLLLEHMHQTDHFRPTHMPVTGKDLTHLGYKEGRLMGQTLRILQNTWEEDPLNITKSQLIALAKSLLD